MADAMKIESMRDDPVLVSAARLDALDRLARVPAPDMAKIITAAAQAATPGIVDSILDGLPELRAVARDAARDVHYQQRRATLMSDLVTSGMSVDAVAGIYHTNAGDVARSLRLLMVDKRATQPWRRGALDA